MKSFPFVSSGTQILAITFAIISSILPIVAIFAGSTLGVLIFLPIWIISCIIILYNCFGKKIEIDEYGVRFIAIYKKHELIWSEIKEIGISNLFVGYRGGAPVIYFSTQYNVGNYISTEMIGDNLILMRYRKSAIKEIRKYWPSDIFGYNQK